MTHTFVDTYTKEELMQASLWCLTNMKGDHQTFVGFCDRAMLLFTTLTAVHGESLRILRWSDMFVLEIPMDDVHMGLKIPVSLILPRTFCNITKTPVLRSLLLWQTMLSTTRMVV
jgi:hypothetical protein